MTTHDHDEKDNFVMSNESEDTDLDASQEEDYYISEGSNLRKPRMLPWIVGAVVLVLLIALFVSMFGGDDNGSDTAQLKNLEDRIARMEERLDAIAGLKEGLSRVENLDKTLANLVVRFDNLESGIVKQVDQLDQKLAEIRKENAAAPAPPAKAAPAPTESEKKTAAPKLHEVQAGETLYGISHNAGLTVEQLRSYNKLSPADTIQPGQKLRLTPP